MRIPIAISVQWWTLVSSSHLTRNEQESGSNPLVGSPISLSRPFLDEGEKRRVVPAAPSLGLQDPKHLLYECRDGERHPVLPARRQGYRQILAVVFNLAPGSEFVRRELLALDLEYLVGCETPREHLYDSIRSHTGLRA